jgi:multicomponent K+:H+ antiporter subunit D
MNMSHLLVFPILLPALTAALLLLTGRNLGLTRLLSFVATLILLGICVALFSQAISGDIFTYALGDWVAPFGIVLVLDRLSGMLILLTSIIAVAALFYAMQGWDGRGKYFHALFQFQLMGINGAFLTGDLFNLFVFFEVLLIASYCLLMYGFGERRLRASVHYVAINLTGSAIFLIGVSVLYGITGTLNMAQLAERVATSAPEDIALIRSASLLLLGVFGIKAALFPLYFWLPSAYSSASAPVAALFAIMTKVGVYAILRFTTLVFGGSSGASADLTAPWLLPVALLTLGLAALGALAAKRLLELVAYLTIASVGTILIAVAAGGQAGLSSALFYLLHSTLIVAALFLLAEMIGQARGPAQDFLHSGPALLQPVLLGVIFILGAVIVAGLPLSSGFLAKLMILKSTAQSALMPWVWGTILVTSLLTLIGLARAGSMLFWKTSHEISSEASYPRVTQWLPVLLLLVTSLLMVIYAAPLKRFTDATAMQLKAPAQYISVVLQHAQDRTPRALPKEAK